MTGDNSEIPRSWHLDQVRRQTWYRDLERRLFQSEPSNRDLAAALDVQRVRAEATERKLEALTALVETKATDAQKHMADLVGVMTDRFDIVETSINDMTTQHESLQGRLVSIGTMIESMASDRQRHHSIATPPVIQSAPPNLLGPSGHHWCGHPTSAAPTAPSQPSPMMPMTTTTTAADFGTMSAMASPPTAQGPAAPVSAVPRVQDPRYLAPELFRNQSSVDGASDDGRPHGQSGRNPLSIHGAGKSIHREVNYLISQKTGDSRLTVFDGSIKDFEEW